MKVAHTCGGPVFGRRTAGCPRCDQLAAGAPPVRWANTGRLQEAQKRVEIQAHFASHQHRSGGCGPCCTFGDW